MDNTQTTADVEKIRTALKLGPDKADKIAELFTFDRALSDAEKARGIGGNLADAEKARTMREMNPSGLTLSDIERIRTMLESSGNLGDAEKARSMRDEP